jgi:hypothetical protein
MKKSISKNFLQHFDKIYKQKLVSRGESFQRLFETVLSRISENIIIVETGIVRDFDNWEGDGNSTVIFDDLVNQIGGMTVTIDIDFQACFDATLHLSEKSRIIWGDSISVLASIDLVIPKPIDILYLDSLDIKGNNEIQASLHNLNEFQSANAHLSQNCILFIDDTFGIHYNATLEDIDRIDKFPDIVQGKGRYLLEFFNKIGVHFKFTGYQQIVDLKDTIFTRHAINGLSQSSKKYNPYKVMIPRSMLLHPCQFIFNHKYYYEGGYHIPLNIEKNVVLTCHHVFLKAGKYKVQFHVKAKNIAKKADGFFMLSVANKTIAIRSAPISPQLIENENGFLFYFDLDNDLSKAQISFFTFNLSEGFIDFYGLSIALNE